MHSIVTGVAEDDQLSSNKNHGGYTLIQVFHEEEAR